MDVRDLFDDINNIIKENSNFKDVYLMRVLEEFESYFLDMLEISEKEEEKQDEKIELLEESLERYIDLDKRQRQELSQAYERIETLRGLLLKSNVLSKFKDVK